MPKVWTSHLLHLHCPGRILMPTLTIRSVDQETYDRFRLAAKMRDMTQGEYLAALVKLHSILRSRADQGQLVAGVPASVEIRDLLNYHGLGTVEG